MLLTRREVAPSCEAFENQPNTVGTSEGVFQSKIKNPKSKIGQNNRGLPRFRNRPRDLNNFQMSNQQITGRPMCR